MQTQNYCLQAFFNLAHNKEFAMSIVNSDLMEDFIVSCMVNTNRRVFSMPVGVAVRRRKNNFVLVDKDVFEVVKDLRPPSVVPYNA